jgi:hypothetical protein
MQKQKLQKILEQNYKYPRTKIPEQKLQKSGKQNYKYQGTKNTKI